MTDDVILLLVVFVGFYLADCVLLLRPTEALVDLAMRLRRRRGKKPGGWANSIGGMCLSLGLTWLPVRRRIPAILNPLTPWRFVFRTEPLTEEPTGRQRLGRHHLVFLRLHGRGMSLMLLSHAALLFLVMPYYLILNRLGPLLISLGFAFAMALVVILSALPMRRVLKLSHWSFWSIALQSLVCLPTSLNFPRKLALLGQSRRSVADWLPYTNPDQQRTIALELARTIDEFDLGSEGKLAGALAISRQYQGEGI